MGTGLQTNGPGTAAPSGSALNSANAQILKKSSAYWVATTHVQYNLDMADINIAANRTADAKANMDSAAAAYFGCGDTNPVPLPKYRGTQITYPTVIDGTDIGSNATTMSIYGVANKRASNYKTAKSVPDKTASATSPGTTKTVAELNIEVGTAFSATTPTTATVQAIRDATNTIFDQAAQRYIAKITLASHMPGNGMGGSTKSYWKSATWGIWAAVDETQATACGGSNAQMPQAQEATTGVTGAETGITKYSLQMNGGLACSKMESGAGTAASNTATFRTVQPVVSQTGSGAGQGNGANGGGGETAVQSPTAAATAVGTACPTVSGVQKSMNCLPATTSDIPYTVPMVVAPTARSRRPHAAFPRQLVCRMIPRLRRLASAPTSSSTTLLTVVLPMGKA